MDAPLGNSFANMDEQIPLRDKVTPVLKGTGTVSDRCPQDLATRLALWGGADALDRICREVTEEQAVLVEHSALLEEALVRIADGMVCGGKKSEFREAQLRGFVRLAIDELLRRDGLRLALGDRCAQPGSERDELIVSGMGFYDGDAHCVAVRFNALPSRTRRVFFAILIGHTPPEEVLEREGGWPSVQAMLRGLFKVILGLRGSEESSP